jgi:hypothetical protein
MYPQTFIDDVLARIRQLADAPSEAPLSHDQAVSVVSAVAEAVGGLAELQTLTGQCVSPRRRLLRFDATAESLELAINAEHIVQIVEEKPSFCVMYLTDGKKSSVSITLKDLLRKIDG